MDYEKAYKETIDKLRKLHNDWKSTQNRAAKEIELVFPELCESEDEKIRYSLMSFLNSLSETEVPSKEEFKKWWMWLEKQGEQNLNDKVEPKFKVGDKKELKKIEQKPDELLKGEVNLVESKSTCCYNDGLYYAIDILKKTLGKVEGYQSDDGILEHQKAIAAVNTIYHTSTVWREEQKSAWSEEDENLYKWCVSAIQTRYNDGLFTTSEYKQTKLWLRSLKERIGG